MKKSIVKIISSVMFLTLILSFSGCSDKNNSVVDEENNNEALPTAAQEDDTNCDTDAGG